MMKIVQLFASPFFGGPESQVLGVAQHLPSDYETVFVSLPENGLGRDVLQRAAEAGFESIELEFDWPRLRRVLAELSTIVKQIAPDVICTNGYKPDTLGWMIGKRLRLPTVAIAHGWTAARPRVRFYETVDRWVLRRMDAIVAVSHAQAARLRSAGVPESRIATIHNAIDVNRSSVRSRGELEALLPGIDHASSESFLMVAAGRLSPEKGFDLLLDAFCKAFSDNSRVGLIVFGEGPQRPVLQRTIDRLGLNGRVLLAGFRTELTAWLFPADALIIPSHTEGLPVVLLEAMACGLPVVATAVGGIPEVVQDGTHGLLVPRKDATKLAFAMRRVSDSADLRIMISEAAKCRVRDSFNCADQSEKYQRLFDRVVTQFTHRVQPSTTAVN